MLMKKEAGGGLQLAQPMLKAVKARQSDLMSVDPQAQHDKFKDSTRLFKKSILYCNL